VITLSELHFSGRRSFPLPAEAGVERHVRLFCLDPASLDESDLVLLPVGQMTL
jgi:hypothetical protein